MNELVEYWMEKEAKAKSSLGRDVKDKMKASALVRSILFGGGGALIGALRKTHPGESRAKALVRDIGVGMSAVPGGVIGSGAGEAAKKLVEDNVGFGHNTADFVTSQLVSHILSTPLVVQALKMRQKGIDADGNRVFRQKLRGMRDLGLAVGGGGLAATALGKAMESKKDKQ